MPYPDQDLFGTVDEALDKAKVLGCYIDNDSYHEESLDNETFFMPCATHEEYEEVSNEDRAVDLSVPKYIQENAKRGLEYYSEGFGGDGLVDSTIRDARNLANGEVSERKIKLMQAWFLRHSSDLEGEQSQAFINGETEKPSAGIVSWLLWGGSISKSNQMDAQEWAARKYEQILEEEDRSIEVSASEEAEVAADSINIKGYYTMVNTTVETNPKPVVPSNEVDRRYVTQEIEIREEGEVATVAGYGAVFDRKSQPLGFGFLEEVKKGAFSKSINDIKPNSKSDIKLLLDHSSDKVLASLRAGSLLLKEDNIGLYYEGRLDTRISHANDAYLMAKNGLITNSSFGFQVIEDDWVVSENADDPVVRHLTNVKLHEVSMVAFPAYQDSSVTALRTIRNLSEKSGLKEEELLEAIKDNQLRNLLIDTNDIDDEGSVVFNKQKRNRTLVLLNKKATKPEK